MTHDQMVAWLILEGWVPYPATGKDLAAAQNDKAGCVLEMNGEVTYVPRRFGWEGPTTWDKMSSQEIGKIYDTIQEHEND